MLDLRQLEAWFVTGSQDLYGQQTLNQVAEHSRAIAQGLSDSAGMPMKIVFKPVLTTPDAIYQLCLEANSAKNCIGVVMWMHTFSPAKMWIAGLKALQKPFVHLHTQFNRELPWATIDMEFMNLNQSAHGDREFGYIASRMRLNRKVVVGFGRTKTFARNLRPGCVRRVHGTTRRSLRSRASATTCAKSRSP